MLNLKDDDDVRVCIDLGSVSALMCRKSRPGESGRFKSTIIVLDSGERLILSGDFYDVIWEKLKELNDMDYLDERFDD